MANRSLVGVTGAGIMLFADEGPVASAARLPVAEVVENSSPARLTTRYFFYG